MRATQRKINQVSRVGMWQVWSRRYGLVVVVYFLAGWFTDAYFMGDTVHYANSILKHISGINAHYWDFGHLLWRPLAYVCYRLANPLTSSIYGADPRLNVTLSLWALSWLTGLLGTLLMYVLVSLFCARTWVKNVVTIAFVLSNAYLNYFQTGSSYVPGLMLLLLGLYILLKDGKDNVENARRQGFLAGVALSGSVCLWFPYVLSFPAAIFAPLILFGYERKR